MIHILLILLGWTMCAPAILLGPLARRTIDASTLQRPWVDGVFKNLWRAYAKYDTTSWYTRMQGIYHNPKLTLQYIKVLWNKQNVSNVVSQSFAKVEDLVASHDVTTHHEHHRNRVLLARSHGYLDSKFGPIIVVGNRVHDGNHRLAAYKEAGVKYIQVHRFYTKTEDERITHEA